MKILINSFNQSLLRITAMLVICIMLLGSCSKDDQITPPVKKTYVLVHGSFQAAYTWNGVKAELEQQGYKVIVVELPGHGDDFTNPASITMDTYRDKVISSIKEVNGKVILIGHSMGGMVISAVAEAVPTKIERLIYLAAFVPKSGQSLIELASMDTEGQLAPLLVPSADQFSLGISDVTKVPAIFCEDGSVETKQLLIDKYRPDPAIPFNNKITLSEANFGTV